MNVNWCSHTTISRHALPRTACSPWCYYPIFIPIRPDDDGATTFLEVIHRWPEIVRDLDHVTVAEFLFSHDSTSGACSTQRHGSSMPANAGSQQAQAGSVQDVHSLHGCTDALRPADGQAPLVFGIRRSLVADFHGFLRRTILTFLSFSNSSRSLLIWRWRSFFS